VQPHRARPNASRVGTMSALPLEDFCCDECFDHAWLRALARANKGHTGRCYYCGNCAALTAVPLFRNGFVNLLKDYIPAFAANGGRDPYLPSVPVIEAIQRDWKLFSTRCSPERGYSASCQRSSREIPYLTKETSAYLWFRFIGTQCPQPLIAGLNFGLSTQSIRLTGSLIMPQRTSMLSERLLVRKRNISDTLSDRWLQDSDSGERGVSMWGLQTGTANHCH
jgi:hypothetical protein